MTGEKRHDIKAGRRSGGFARRWWIATLLMVAVTTVRCSPEPPIRDVDRRLIAAVQRDSLPDMQAAISGGANVNALSNGEAPLHLAAIWGKNAAVALLIAAGANPNIKGRHGFTPIQQAASMNEASTVELLIGQGANPDVLDESGQTPLFHAAGNEAVDAARVLLKYHANPLIPRRDGRLPLDNALNPGRQVNSQQQAEMVRLLTAVSGQ